MVRRKRKNYLPSLILLLISWAALGLMVYFVEPQLVKNIIIPNFYLPFFINLFLCLFLSLSFILNNSKRGFLWSLGVVVFLIFRLYKIGNLLNAILIVGCLLSLDYHFTNLK